jgi:hypothetical protein
VSGKEAASDVERLRKDLTALVDFIEFHVSKMHRDISDRERSGLADDFCCDWVHGGMGVAYTEFKSK